MTYSRTNQKLIRRTALFWVGFMLITTWLVFMMRDNLQLRKELTTYLKVIDCTRVLEKIYPQMEMRTLGEYAEQTKDCRNLAGVHYRASDEHQGHFIIVD